MRVFSSNKELLKSINNQGLIGLVTTMGSLHDGHLSLVKKALNNNPKSQDYYKAAVFYLEENLDINLAKKWIDRCFELRKDTPYWMLQKKSLIYLSIKTSVNFSLTRKYISVYYTHIRDHETD